jgi:hypothetical protein
VAKKKVSNDSPLVCDGGSDYILKDDSVWITVKGFSVLIKKTDEGVVCDIYQKGSEDCESIAGTYAYDDDLDSINSKDFIVESN